MASERIERLRRHALEKKIDHTEWYYLFHKGWMAFHGQRSSAVRTALAQNFYFENVHIEIDPDELVVGKLASRSLDEAEAAEWSALKQVSVPAARAARGQNSHLAIDFDLLLSRGISGIAADIRQRMGLLDTASPGAFEKYDFYESCLAALDGLAAFSRRYAGKAAEMAEAEADPTRRAELAEIARICAKVPFYPAESFYEAVQSAHFVNYALTSRNQLFQLGRPDRYLIGYYRSDLESGAITPQRAQELIDCMGILLNEQIVSGSAIGLMVGGTDADGNDACNELTCMFLKSIGHVRMCYPGVGLCCHSGMAPEVLEIAYDMLGQGLSHPALFNDRVIVSGLKRYGLSDAEACLYIHSTCVEITPVAASASWVASPYTNLPQLLLDCINEADCSIGFEELKAAFYLRLGRHIRTNVINENRDMMERTLHTRDPILSCFVNDCIEKGLDIEAGGARYNWIMPSFVGAANLADALAAIKQLVFTERRFSLEQLRDMLAADFEGYEKERLIIKNHAPKYGNDDDFADDFVLELAEFLVGECARYTTYRGGRFIPSLFCWIMHEHLGRNTGATPDGRTAGFPLGDGSGPAQGNERNGPTASVLSSTKWEHEPFIGGVAVNMKFSKKLFSGGSREKLDALVKSFMQRGGFEMQVNVVDANTLKDAREHPEKYADLVVRVGGYSDFFVRLSPQMQQEVLARTEHTL